MDVKPCNYDQNILAAAIMGHIIIWKSPYMYIFLCLSISFVRCSFKCCASQFIEVFAQGLMDLCESAGCIQSWTNIKYQNVCELELWGHKLLLAPSF